MSDSKLVASLININRNELVIGYKSIYEVT